MQSAGSVTSPPGGSHSPGMWLDEQFSEPQLAQLRGAIEDSVRVAIRSEYKTLASQIRQDLSAADAGFRTGGLTAPVSEHASCSKEMLEVLEEEEDHSAAGTGFGTGGLAAPVSEHASCSREGSKKLVEASTVATLEDIPTRNSQSEKRSEASKMVIELVEGVGKTTSFANLVNTQDRIQYWARRLVHGRKGSAGTRFDAVMGCIIVANSFVIAVETQLKVENKEPGYLFWMESFFLLCFVGELLVRYIADGKRNFSSAWFWFDFILVVTGVISTWLVDSLRRANASLEDVPLISQVLALRVLRLFRLVRALRLMESFRELWKLCSGLLKSARTMMSVCLLVLVAIFVFACLGVDMITFSDTLARNPETDAIVKKYFYSLPMVMLTLMQFANADSIASIYMPLCREQPLLVIYFLVLWLVVTVALMNLVTAIIVESAMGQGREDAEERKNELRKVLRRILPEIHQVFDNLDEDGSGSLAIEEIEDAARNGSLVLPDDIKEYVEPDRLRDVFDFLDVDQSGEIDKTEFVDGICTLAVSAVPIETTQILQLLRHTHLVLMETRDAVGRMSDDRPPG